MGIVVEVKILIQVTCLVLAVVFNKLLRVLGLCPFRRTLLSVTDALSTILRLLGEESEVASWLIEARSIMEPVELYDEEW